MGRTVIIGILMVFAIFNLLLGLGFYLFLKKEEREWTVIVRIPCKPTNSNRKTGSRRDFGLPDTDCNRRDLCFSDLK